MSSIFNRHISARRVVASAMTALIMTASQAAASEAGIWKIDAAKSKFSANSATLTIRKVEGAASSAGGFVVISGAGVYRVTGATAAESRGLKPADFANMTRAGEAVLIGTNPRSWDYCSFRCTAGLPEKVRTVTFTVVKNGEKQIRDMLAYDDTNW